MELDDSYFDPEAPLGAPVRFMHEGCSTGKDPCLIVTRTEDGWYVYCHRCKRRGFKPVRGLSPTNMVKFIQSSKKHVPVVDADSVMFPEDYTDKIPPRGLVWALKYMTIEDLVLAHAVYSQSYDRVIFPIYNANTMIAWQGRKLTNEDPNAPKWLLKRIASNKHTLYKVDNCGSDAVVLVEDVPSAIAVGKVMDCYALLGTYVPEHLYLNVPYDKVIIWLDADAIKLALKYQQKFRQIGKMCKIVYTCKDPKEYSAEEIRCQLK